MPNVIACARSLLLFLAVAACGAASSQTAPEAPEAGATAGTKGTGEAAPPSGGCIPSAAFAADDENGIVGVHVLPGPRLCMYEGSAFAGSYRGCWRYDEGGGVTPVDPAPRDGVAVYSDSDYALTVSDGGGVSAAIGSERMRITERGRTIADRSLFSDSEPEGVSSQVSDAFLVNRLLIVVDAFAGPHAALLAFELDGTLIGQIVPEVFGAAVSVLDDYRVGVAAGSLSGIEVYDTRTRKLARYERDMPKVPCTDEQIEMFELEGDSPCDDEALGGGATRACCDALEATRGRYDELGGMAALPDGSFLVAFAGERLGEVAVVTTAGAGATISREASLRCPR